MTTPFPGMAPYIEASGLWGDFHHDFISEIKPALASSAAPDRYIIRAGERSGEDSLGLVHTLRTDRSSCRWKRSNRSGDS